ncbi:MAG: hypothetical protein K9W43_03095 [Candidatus Thorarchaeota archaeon]|nr:hypothetical protein [Candidatus Thorarchaeota archaeon]
MTSDADENYWLGVRDALRMVDSFIEWARLNPDRAKPLAQFINEALIAAARRCKSCLTHTLGVTFAASQEEEKRRISARPTVDFFEDTQTMIESSPLADTLSNPDDLYGTPHREEPPAPPVPEAREPSPSETRLTDTTPSFEMTPPSPTEESMKTAPEIEFVSHHEGPRIETEQPAQFHEVTPPHAEPEESSPLETLERTGEMSEADISPEGLPRDFSTDFQLVEPEPLSTEETKHETAPEDDETIITPESSTTYEDDISTEEPEPRKSDETKFIPDDAFKDAIAEIDRVLDEAFAIHSEAEDHTPETDEPSEFTWHDYEDTMTPQESPLEPSSEPSITTDEEEIGTEPEADYDQPLVTPPPSTEATQMSETPVSEEPLVTPPPPETMMPPTEEEPSDASERYTEEMDESPSTTSYEEPIEERKPWSAPPESRDAWSPYDEPSIDHEAKTSPLEEPEKDMEEITSSEDEPTTVTTPPPPPPPPPEPDESEEERQKRTRRLFFGA